MYLAGPKKAVIERDADLSPQEEMRSHSKEVAAAPKEELQICVHHECFARRPRTGARNILDLR